MLDRRDLQGFDVLVQETWERFETLSPAGLDFRDMAFLEVKGRQRLGGYARCKVLASGDPTWCDVLDTMWPGDTAHCKAVASLWYLVGKRVIRDGESCSSVVGEASWHFEFLEDHGPALCTAIADARPDLCPEFFDGTPGAPICEVAASRDGAGICRERGEKHEWWKACCERFASRFRAFVDPGATSGTSPELGAVSGDEKGCARALQGGLVQDLGFLLGIAGHARPDDTDAALKGGEAACRPLVPWEPSP